MKNKKNILFYLTFFLPLFENNAKLLLIKSIRSFFQVPS
jgi:hypothetical protein